jgi:putative FmdB family regulatory protein
MPIYEFVCESCGRTVERLQKLTDPPPEACPECGGRMAKIMSRNSFQLKGGGWYRDLYASSGDRSTGDSKPSGADAKPASPEKTTESVAPTPTTAAPKKD